MTTVKRLNDSGWSHMIGRMRRKWLAWDLSSITLEYNPGIHRGILASKVIKGNHVGVWVWSNGKPGDEVLNFKIERDTRQVVYDHSINAAEAFRMFEEWLAMDDARLIVKLAMLEVP